MTCWTNLEGTALWEAAKREYQRDPRRHFHNFDHVLRRYWHAEHTLGLRYDAQLDKAILAHDVIYDDAPEKERRSAEWLVEHDGLDNLDACRHIIATAAHEIRADNRMIILDLLDLADPKRRLTDRELIRTESIALYGIDSASFSRANASFFRSIEEAWSDTAIAARPKSERPWLLDIRAGMRAIIEMAETEAAQTA